MLANASLSSDASSGEVKSSTCNADGVAYLWILELLPMQMIAVQNGSTTTHGVLSKMTDGKWEFEATDSWGLTFSAFSGAVTRLHVATDESGVLSVFYLGTDGGLRRFDADDIGHRHTDSERDKTQWPLADVTADGYADFGLAYDTAGNRIWIIAWGEWADDAGVSMCDICA